MTNLGFIGFGNMAKAIVAGITKNEILDCNEINIYDPAMADDNCEFNICKSTEDLVEKSDYIILAVKPNIMPIVLKEISPFVGTKPVGSIAAGITREFILSYLKDAHVLRIMPNTCATVLKSYTLLNKDNNLSRKEFHFFNTLFTGIGTVDVVNESYFNICASVASCGVAFGHMLIESMADGGVVCGYNKQKSVEMAAHAILGACEMILQTGESPMSLKDKICSPGGMTVKAMQTLEEGNFRATTISAIEQAYLKGSKL